MQKKLLLSFVLLLLSSAFMFSQTNQDWKWSHEFPQGNTLRWCKMLDANNWVAAGLYGTFVKTTNAGATWSVNHKAAYPGTANGLYGSIYDGHFFSATNGILVGQYGMVKTTNGGATWDTIPGLPISATWYQVWFRDANVGFASGTSTGRLARTTDGGATWTLNTTIPSASYYDVWSPNDNLILVANSAGVIQKSTDNGVTWVAVATGNTNPSYKMTFAPDNLTGIIASSSTGIKLTTDAGTTWSMINTGVATTTAFYDADIVGSTFYVTGNSFTIFKSTNLGVSWDTVNVLAPTTPWTSTYYATDFLSETNFLTVGAFGLLNSRNGENIKNFTQFRKAGSIRDVWANPAANRIVTVGFPSSTGSAFDQIFVSTNFGASWNVGTTTFKPKQTGPVEVPEVTGKEMTKEDVEFMTPNSLSSLYSISMVSNTVGFACGNLSAVYKTTNGGLTWDSLATTIPASQLLYKVQFIDANTGWIFGQTANASGTIWKTTDGGATWAQSILTGTTGSSGQIYGAHMLNANVGYILNYTPKPYKTTDGGATWTAQTLSDGFGGFLYGIYMFDENNGWCVGSSNRLYKTTDGGTTWNVQTVPTTASLYDIKFITPNKGIIVGSSGVSLLTNDGGATWTLNQTGAAGTTLYNVWAGKGANDSLFAVTVGTNASIMTYGVATVPVELTSFTGSASKDVVVLNWSTATETNNKGFSVERKSGNGSYSEVKFIDGKGTTTEKQNYSFTEKLTNGKYTYRLRQVDFDGSSVYSKEVEVNVGAPDAYALSQNYPNPFNPSTTLKYALPVDGMVTLAVYNTLGEKVATVVNQHMQAGNYEVSFDASSLSSGIYFYKLESGSFVSVKKMMLIK